MNYLRPVQEVINLFFDDQGELDLGGLVNRLQKNYSGFDSDIKDQLYTAFTNSVWFWLSNIAVKALLEWVGALILPGAAVIQKIYKGVMWALDNAGQILCILQKAFGLLKQAISPGGKGAVAKGVFGILKGAVGVLLKLLGKLLGLDALPTAINAVLNTLKMQVEKWITNLLARLLKRKKKVTPCKLKPGKPMVKKPGGKFELTLGCSDKAKGSGQCFTGDTLVRGPAGLVLLAQRLPGRLVLTYPDSASETAVSRRAEREGLRLIHLELDYGGGDGVEALLLRGEEWLAAQCVLPGGVLWLGMPEMGAGGWARVKAVTPCPLLEEGAGQRVTGWFRHWRGFVHELRVQGEAKVIGVTLGHPFWSMDRGDWVTVGELRVGERLLAWDGGTPVVESLGLREVPEAVYTIEVDGDHCYRVGEQGLLVHNASVETSDEERKTTGCWYHCNDQSGVDKRKLAPGTYPGPYKAFEPPSPKPDWLIAPGSRFTTAQLTAIVMENLKKHGRWPGQWPTGVTTVNLNGIPTMLTQGKGPGNKPGTTSGNVWSGLVVVSDDTGVDLVFPEAGVPQSQWNKKYPRRPEFDHINPVSGTLGSNSYCNVRIVEAIAGNRPGRPPVSP